MGSYQSIGVCAWRKYPKAAMRSMFSAGLSFYRQNVPQCQCPFTSFGILKVSIFLKMGLNPGKKVPRLCTEGSGKYSKG